VRSGARSRATGLAAALIAALTVFLTDAVAQTTEPPPPSRQEIVAAIEKLRADPNLGLNEKKRVLKRNNAAAPPPPTNPNLPAWLSWIADLLGWVASTARILVWMIAIFLAGILGLVIKRLIESRGESLVPVAAFSMPTHVQSLDIRPESLPADIGGASLELWERGEHRAALALLYRGLLSRLAHIHGVPIRDSSTEGDCLALAAARLPARPSTYATQLIRLWQRAVYGNMDPTPEEFRAVSMGFAAAVDAVPLGEAA
jgi:hypothetical protein